MKGFFTRQPGYNRLEQSAWLLVWFSLPVSAKLGGAGIFLAALAILVSFARSPFIPDRRKIGYLSVPVVFFFWHAKELIGSDPVGPVWKESEQMLSFLVIPVIFALSRIRKDEFTRIAATGLTAALAVSGVTMLAAACLRFSGSGDWHEFTYHNLAKPIHTGAVYFSLYLLFALFSLHAVMKNRPGVKTVIALFFLALLLLSASKLMIGLGLPLLAWYYRQLIIRSWKKQRLLIIAAGLLIIMGLVPFIKRAEMLLHPRLEIVGSDSFRDAPEPNGLSLRLILLRFGAEILDEQHAWLNGVGMVESQPLLNLKFLEYDMYTGTGRGADTGYLNYNFHNQFMETLVRTGIPGLLILLLLLIIFAMQPRDNLFAPKLFMLVITGFFLTESVLERQAGIVFFCLVFSAYFIFNNDAFNTNKQQN